MDENKHVIDVKDHYNGSTMIEQELVDLVCFYQKEGLSRDAKELSEAFYTALALLNTARGFLKANTVVNV